MARASICFAAALALLGAPVLALDVLYDGASDIYAFGWRTYEGVYQGVSESGVWHLNDTSDKKTKLKYGSGVSVDGDTGVYLESRMKCVAMSDSSVPLNLGLGANTPNLRRELTVRPGQIVMDGKEYAGAFSDYHVIRMCYKYLNRTNLGRAHSWAVYLDGGSVPALWTSSGQSDAKGGGPLWGAGNTGTTQDLYFDYVNFLDDGAWPCPEMDGTVSFVGGDPDATLTPTSFTAAWTTNTPTDGIVYWRIAGAASWTTAPDPSNPTLKTSHSVTVGVVAAGNTYEFFAISTDSGGKKAVSLPSSFTIPNPFNITSGPTATVDSATSVTIAWTTSLPDDSSEVHFGRSTEAGEWTTGETPGGGKTAHSVTISPPPGNLIYYYVRSTLSPYPPAQSAVGNFSTSIADDPYLDKVNFELLSGAPRDYSPWVKFGSFDGLKAAFEDGFLPEFQWCIGSIATYTVSKSLGGMSQTVPTTSGQYYKATVDIWTRRQAGPIVDPVTHYIVGPTPDPSHPLDVACRIGIDPFGGGDPASTTVCWGPWTETSASEADNENCTTANAYFEEVFDENGVASSWLTWKSPTSNSIDYSQSTDPPSLMGSHQKWGRVDALAFNGGICQAATVKPYWPYTVSGLIRFTGTSNNTCAIGYDATGQTADPNATTIVWKILDGVTPDSNGWRSATWYNVFSSGNTISVWCKLAQNGAGAGPTYAEADDVTLNPGYQGGPWEPISASVRAAATTATVFLQQLHKWPINWLQTGFDNAVWETTAAPAPIGVGGVKALPDGQAVLVQGGVVTLLAWFYDWFALEQTDQCCAVRVITPYAASITPPSVGDTPVVSGFTQTLQTGERVIVATQVDDGGTGTLPGPLGVTNRSVGLGSCALLVRTCGRVRAERGINLDLSSWFTIDDGSAVPGEGCVGLKINTVSPIPDENQYVVVTGISGLELLDPTLDPGDEYVVRSVAVLEGEAGVRVIPE